MSSAPDSRNPVEVLAEEFLARVRRGEDVNPQGYAAEYPDRAAEILALFPALLMMEDLGGDSGDPTGSIVSGGAAVTGVISGRLGDFRLLREIGRGGMGVVYEAEEESLGRRVALKVLPAGVLADEKQVGRFEREARSAARLHHTNIVPVFGVGRHEGTHFYAMQFIDGQGLDAVLEELKQMRHARMSKVGAPARSPRQGPVANIALSLATGNYAAEGNNVLMTGNRTAPWIAPPAPGARPSPSPSLSDSNHSSGHGPSSVTAFSETDRRYAAAVARIGVQVAEALAHAHGQGILHRDIKPSNLLLDREGTVWVADFGLAKAAGADDLTHTGDIVGTVRYMAPERFRGEGDARADIYALGLTLYEMLALRPAFDEADRNGLIRQVTQDVPPRLRRLNKAVPLDLETVVHKAMSRDPGQRYPSSSALAEDLKRFIEGRSILARRVSSSERAYQWCKRNPAIAGLLGTVAVLLVAASIASTWAAFHFSRIAESEKLARAEGALALRQAVEARREAVKQSRSAEAHFGRARKAVDESFIAVSESKLLNVPGLRALRADLLGSSLKFYEEFLRERSDDPSLKDDLLRTRLRIAEVLIDLGRSKEAGEAFHATVAGYEQALRDRPDDLDLKAGLADALSGTGGGMPRDEWVATVRRVVVLREDVFRGRPTDRRAKQNLGLALSRLQTHLGESHPAEALAALERSVALRLELAEEFPDDPDAVDGAFTAFFKLARATESTQSLALYRRALEFGRESLQLRPNDVLTVNDFTLTAQGMVDQLAKLGRKDEAISELRRSVKTLDEMARGNPDTPVIQEQYIRIIRSLADRLAEQKKPGEAARALLETRVALERLSRDTADDIARAATWSLDIVQRLGEIQPDLTTEQKAQRDELLDRVVSDYQAAVAGGWKDVAVIKDAAPLKTRPGYSALLAEAETAARRPEKPAATGNPRVATATSKAAAAVPRPRLDAKLDRARTAAALGAARARAGLMDEALASMSKARALFDDLARERPGDPEVTRSRIDARLGDYAALQALALDRLKRGKTEESILAQKMADNLDAELAREQPDDPEIAAARRRVLLEVADFRREASRRGEIYQALRKEESSARQLAQGASAGSPAARNAVAGLSRVGHGYGKLALWDEAAAAIRTAYEIDPVGLQDVDGAWDKGYFAWYRVSVLLIQAGETDAYERLRAKLLRENAAGSLRSPLDQIRIATLRPDPHSDWKQVFDLTEMIPENNPWGQTVRGFALLRAGRDRDALDRFKKDSEWINAWPARAIAHHRLGQAALAREWLARADQHLREDLDEALAGAGFTQSGWTSWWDDWLLRMIWTREAHELIEGKVWPDVTWMRQQRVRALARVGEAN